MACEDLSYRYDANGNRTRVTHPDGWFFEYGFDDVDRFTSLNESANSVPTASSVPLLSVDYHPGGGRHHLTRPSGATTEYLQDNLKRLESFSQDFYGTEHDLVASFDYNPASQVIFRARSNDLYAITGTPSRAGVYQRNGLNQYTAVGGKTLAYDGNGNLTSYRDANDELVTYGYDMENRLVSATGTVGGQSVTASLTWDPLGRLHQVTINGVPRQFLYDGDALVAEYSGSTLVRRYVHGDQVDEPLVQYDNGAVGAQWRRYLHADHQGSVIAQSGHTGMVYSTNAYDPYGIPAATNSGRFGYTGQAWLAELGLYHYKARVYHPRIGRFLQTDPIFYEDDFNMYAYVGNDAPNKTDPTGAAAKGKAVAYAVKLTGSGMKVVGRLTFKQAVRLRRLGRNVLGNRRQTSRQIEVAAHGKEDLLKHSAHNTGYRPHYQTEGKLGHTFWSVVGAAALTAAEVLENTAEAAETTGDLVVELSDDVGEVVDMLDPLQVEQRKATPDEPRDEGRSSPPSWLHQDPICRKCASVEIEEM